MTTEEFGKMLDRIEMDAGIIIGCIKGLQTLSYHEAGSDPNETQERASILEAVRQLAENNLETVEKCALEWMSIKKELTSLFTDEVSENIKPSC